MSAAGVLTLAYARVGRAPEAVAATIPGGTLDARSIQQFVTRLVVPPVMARNRVETTAEGQPVDFYELHIRQFNQQMLPAGNPKTPVWGYVSATDPNPLVHTPAATIETPRDRPVRVLWRNKLVDEKRRYLPHMFAVDPTLHWANPEQPPDAAGRPMTDRMPSFAGQRYVPRDRYTSAEGTYTAYTGPVPISVHLHGAMGLGDESDGYPESWVLPDASDIPDGYARHGRWWQHLSAKATALTGHTVPIDGQLAQYPNKNRPTALWIHDHALGLTRLNVMAGYTGFYMIRPAKDSDQPLDSATGRPAVLPGTGADPTRAGELPHELPLAIQDRSFNQDGTLFYPDSRRHFDASDTFLPASGIAPIWVPEFWGNAIVVNGRTWPYADLRARRYRLIALNACNSRSLSLDFRKVPRVQVHLIGNDGGLLPQVADLFASKNPNWGQLPLGPGERADLILDLTDTPPGRYVLGNTAGEILFPGTEGWLIDQQPKPHETTTGRVMELRVGPALGSDPTTPARRLRMPAIPDLPAADSTVRIALDMTHQREPAEGVPTQVSTTYLSQIVGDPRKGPVKVVPKMWSDPVWFNPQVGETVDVEVYNWSVVPHPVHLHEVSYQVVSRSAISYDDETGDLAIGQSRPLEPIQTGRKETIMVFPGEMAQLRATFNHPGQFVIHCHLLEHEDNEMMVPFRVGPAEDGAPGSVAHEVSDMTMMDGTEQVYDLTIDRADSVRQMMNQPITLAIGGAAAAAAGGGAVLARHRRQQRVQKDTPTAPSSAQEGLREPPVQGSNR
ncbi:multicopper oxidase family protein [Raineyella antarctica]|nr:multicopper oxidase domain-containing protein [Raineyella antarctica]